MRLEKHPILELERGEQVEFFFNQKKVVGYTNETVAAALIAAGMIEFGHSDKLHRARGLFCGIGNCSSCSMRVDGVENTKICVTKCRQGMVVEKQYEGEAQ